MDSISNVFNGKAMGLEHVQTPTENMGELNVMKKIKALEEGHMKNLTENHKMKMFGITERMKGFSSVKPKNAFMPATDKLRAMGIISNNQMSIDMTKYKSHEKMQNINASNKLMSLGLMPRQNNNFTQLGKTYNNQKMDNLRGIVKSKTNVAPQWGSVFNQELQSWQSVKKVSNTTKTPQYNDVFNLELQSWNKGGSNASTWGNVKSRPIRLNAKGPAKNPEWGSVFNQELDSWKSIGQNKNLKPFGDADKDGVPNWLDCKPLDKKKQGFLHDFVLKPGSDKLMAMDAISQNPFSSDESYNARIKLINLGVIPNVQREHNYEHMGIFNKELAGWSTMSDRKASTKVYNMNMVPGMGRLENPERGSVFNQELESWRTIGQRSRLNTFGDADKDGVPNWLDCKPLDRMKQGFMDENGVYRNTETGEPEEPPMSPSSRDTNFLNKNPTYSIGNSTTTKTVPLSPMEGVSSINTNTNIEPTPGYEDYAQTLKTGVKDAYSDIKNKISDTYYKYGYYGDGSESSAQDTTKPVAAGPDPRKLFGDLSNPVNNLKTPYQQVKGYVVKKLADRKTEQEARGLTNEQIRALRNAAAEKAIAQGQGFQGVGVQRQTQSVPMMRTDKKGRIYYDNSIGSRRTINQLSGAMGMGFRDMGSGVDAAVNPNALLRIRQLTGIGGGLGNMAGILSMDRSGEPLYMRMQKWKSGGSINDNIIEQYKQQQQPQMQQRYIEPPQQQYVQQEQTQQPGYNTGGKVYSPLTKRLVQYPRGPYKKHNTQVQY
jgi:hypothetical protein